MHLNYVIQNLAHSDLWKYAHSSFSSLVQSLLPKDTLLRTYLTALQLVTGTVWRW